MTDYAVYQDCARTCLRAFVIQEGWQRAEIDGHLFKQLPESLQDKTEVGSTEWVRVSADSPAEAKRAARSLPENAYEFKDPQFMAELHTRALQDGFLDAVQPQINESLSMAFSRAHRDHRRQQWQKKGGVYHILRRFL